MRFLSLNIQQGGASRAAGIVELVKRHDPDVMVLCEVRPSSAALLEQLAGRGWQYQETGVTENRVACAAVLSKTPLTRSAANGPNSALPGRFIEVDVPEFDLIVAGVYGPLSNEKYGDFWAAVRTHVASRVAGRFVMAGDLNTGESMLDAPNERFFCSDEFVAIRDSGLVDVWRSRNPDGRTFSYHHKVGGGVLGPGFRIDHLLASPAMDERVLSCEYDRSVLEQRVSDHAAVVAEFALSPVPSRRG